METDAKGQLGGLDTSEAERRRYAEASGNWKCGICGRCNREILAETAEAAKANQDGEGSKRVEEEVPKELTIKVKDESEKGSVGDTEEAELAEGFVQTAPIAAPAPVYPPARPAQGVPQLTGSVSTGNESQAAVQNLQQRNIINSQPPAQAIRERAAEVRRSTDGVPIWIDRAIAGVVVCLIFMVLKLLLAS